MRDTNNTRRVEVTNKCVECTKACAHSLTFRIFEADGMYWIASGPHETEKAAVEHLDNAVAMIEAQNDKIPRA